VYKQLFIKERWIAARTLYSMYAREESPMTPGEIAADYDLPLEAVQEAIVYCASNPPELAENHAREEAVMEATGMNDPSYDGRAESADPPGNVPPETAMRLYLDGDSASALLTRLLRQAGHDVRVPSEVGMAGDDDPCTWPRPSARIGLFFPTITMISKTCTTSSWWAPGTIEEFWWSGEITIQNAIWTRKASCELSESC
jgi:uncharacterized protein (DUF433 family)